MSYISTETDSRGVCTITFDRQDTYNAMNRQFMDEFTEALEKLQSNIRLLVIAGSGKHFCAGADIQWMKQSAELSAAENHEDAMALSNLLHTLDTFSCPTIAKVQGAALGGGTGVVCCCDIVIAEDDARFAFSEVRLGIIPATISPYSIAAIGSRAARRYFLTGEQIDATQAHRIGLVHTVCSANELDSELEKVIGALLMSAPGAQAQAKKLIADVAGAERNEKLREGLAKRLGAIRTGEEAQEGLGAFLAKRSPDWID